MSDVSQGPGWWQASDRKWYPPQSAPTAAPPPSYRAPPGPSYGARPAPQWTPPPAKKGGNTGCLIALAVVGVIAVLGIVATVVVIAAVGNEVDERVDEDGITTFSGNDENPPADDVSINECGPAPDTGFMRATVDVLNHSSESSNYIITVAFESEEGDRQLTTSTALVNGLGPDQTATTEANSFQEPPGGVEFSCRISQVERFAA
jgi:hypothetical protein